MENDLISRSALKEKIHDFVYGYRTPKISKGDLEHGLNKFFVDKAPAVDAVSRSVFEQIKWERDCAMQQLKDHGIPFGGIAPAVDDREKLIELMIEAKKADTEDAPFSEFLADFLLASGVTFAKDTDVPSEWISVEDDKPKRRGHYFIAYKFAGSDMRFYGEAFWHDDIPDNGHVQGNHFSNEGVGGMYVTHWMEIQELPEPPRVQEVPNGTNHV